MRQRNDIRTARAYYLCQISNMVTRQSHTVYGKGYSRKGSLQENFRGNMLVDSYCQSTKYKATLNISRLSEKLRKLSCVYNVYIYSHTLLKELLHFKEKRCS